MTLIRVQYDAYNRQFKLLDRELANILEDGEIYLVAELSGNSFEQAEIGEALDICLPHA